MFINKVIQHWQISGKKLFSAFLLIIQASVRNLT